MLQNKDIAKIQEIKILFKDSWIQPEFFSKHLELFNFSKTSKILKNVEKSKNNREKLICKRPKSV